MPGSCSPVSCHPCTPFASIRMIYNLIYDEPTDLSFTPVLRICWLSPPWFCFRVFRYRGGTAQLSNMVRVMASQSFSTGGKFPRSSTMGHGSGRPTEPNRITHSLCTEYQRKTKIQRPRTASRYSLLLRTMERALPVYPSGVDGLNLSQARDQ